VTRASRAVSQATPKENPGESAGGRSERCDRQTIGALPASEAASNDAAWTADSTPPAISASAAGSSMAPEPVVEGSLTRGG